MTSHLKCLMCNQEYGPDEEPAGPCEKCQLDIFVEEFFRKIDSYSHLLPTFFEESVSYKNHQGHQ